MGRLFTAGFVAQFAGAGWLFLAILYHSPLCFWIGTALLVVGTAYIILLNVLVDAARQHWIDEITGRNREE